MLHTDIMILNTTNIMHHTDNIMHDTDISQYNAKIQLYYGMIVRSHNVTAIERAFMLTDNARVLLCSKRASCTIFDQKRTKIE
jgi:hypothetical protein